MPFNHTPQPNVHHWKPDYDTFDQDEERILVYLNWGEKIICSWSSDQRSSGGLVIAPEAIPDNLRSYFGDKLDPYEYAPGEFTQPMLFIYQIENNSLRFELAHPAYEGVFETGGQVYRIHRVQRGRRQHSLEVAVTAEASPSERSGHPERPWPYTSARDKQSRVDDVGLFACLRTILIRSRYSM